MVTLQNAATLIAKAFYTTGRVTAGQGPRRIQQNTRHFIAIMPPERPLNFKFEDAQANPEAEVRRVIRFIDPRLEDEGWIKGRRPKRRAPRRPNSPRSAKRSKPRSRKRAVREWNGSAARHEARQDGFQQTQANGESVIDMCEPNANPNSDGERRSERPNLRDIFSNLRNADMPWHRVLAAVASNNWRKLRTRRDCCGSLGAPGC